MAKSPNQSPNKSPDKDSEQAKELARFPKKLLDLVKAELKAGNEIAEIGHSYPAPPVGAYVMLTKTVSTRPRKAGKGLKYRSQNSSTCSGEFSDDEGFFFVLEPGDPNAGAYPDMDAIREAANRSSGTVQTSSSTSSDRPAKSDRPKSLVEQFEASMVIDYEKWHDGIGYAVELIAKAKGKDRKEIEMAIISRGVNDWRDVEALAALDTPMARKILQGTLKTGKSELRTAVMQYAPALVPEKTKLQTLLHAIETADFYAGLTSAMDEIEEYHPPEIVDAMLKACLTRKGDVACNFSAMLYYIHGKAKEPFDWNHRPFFLRFNTDNATDRRKVFKELCETIGVDPRKYLGGEQS